MPVFTPCIGRNAGFFLNSMALPSKETGIECDMQIRDSMNREVVSVVSTTTVGEAARVLVEKQVGLLPITDDANRLVGIFGLCDMLALFLPAVVDLIDDLDFVHDFGALEGVYIGPEMRAQQISDVMRKPISVGETTSLLRACTMMLQHRLHDLPVVGPNRTLVGIASRVDIGTAFLAEKETDLLGLSQVA
jgi:CBS domain-containing protein